jgi:threonine/homoserine/homoserine lactone efflux protein
MNAIIQGLIFGIALNAAMGPNNREIIRRGFKDGWKAAVAFESANILVFAFYFILIMVGLSFLSESKLFNSLLFAFGVLVLFYLAYDAFKDFFSGKELNLSLGKVSKKHFYDGLMLSLSNPLLLMILLGLIGADSSANPISVNRSILLIVGMFAGFIIFFSIFIPLIELGRKYVHHKYLRYFSLIAGLMLIYFALKFGYKLINSIEESL